MTLAPWIQLYLKFTPRLFSYVSHYSLLFALCHLGIRNICLIDILLFHLKSVTVLWGRYYNSLHFMNQKSQAHRDLELCPVTQPLSDRASTQIHVHLKPMSMFLTPEVISLHASFLSVSNI